MIAIVMTEARAAAENEETFEGKLRAAMKSAAHHWMVLDEPTQQQGALAAVLDLVGPESDEGRRIQHEMKIHRALQAASSGIPVDFGAMLEGDAPEPIGLAKLWTEAKGA
jgi:hypothetical protein